MQIITFKPNEKNKRILSIIFSAFFIVTILILAIVVPIQEAKETPVKTPERVVEQVKKEKEDPKELIDKLQKSALRGKDLRKHLKEKGVVYFINENSEVLTVEKTEEILNTYTEYKAVRPQILNNSDLTIEDLMGKPKTTYSCCSEDDNLVSTITVYEKFVRCEVIKEEGKIVTSDYILVK